MKQLNELEISALECNGCRAEDWSNVLVDDDFTAEKFHNVEFIGRAILGKFTKTVEFQGITLPTGIQNSTLANCAVGDNCLIRNCSLIANYVIGNDVVIVDCGTITATSESTFGIGTEVGVVNEIDCRTVKLSANLTSNVAHIAAFHRLQTDVIDTLSQIIDTERDMQRGKAIIDNSAIIVGCRKIDGVRIGEAAKIDGALSLVDGTILSDYRQPSKIGAGVVAEHFIAAEGAQIIDCAIVKHCYIGQCVEIGNHFSAEHSLMFACSQLLCGEAVAAFCGPFTVSHHKTTLLIASAHSFFNGGSATNASNHHYKLGPLHQAIFDRGAKTGSGSYLLEPAHIGAFSTIIGKHTNHPDTSLFPFSYIIERNGESYLLIGQNLKTVGLFRDAEKWQKRDNRADIAELRRDKFITEPFSPFTIGKVLKAIDLLHKISENGTGETVMYEGVRMQRAMLPRAERAYRKLAEAYVTIGLIRKINDERNVSPQMIDTEWIDCGGLIAPRQRIEKLEQEIANGKYLTIKEIANAFDFIAAEYERDRNAWCAEQAEKIFGLSESDISAIVNAAKRAIDTLTEIGHAMAADAQKEFDRRISVGYGIDGNTPDAAAEEFRLLRGTVESDPTIAACRTFCADEISVAKDFITKFGSH